MGKHDIQNFDVNIINQEYQGGHEWLGNETNAKISDGQALKQQFCRRMNRSHFTKSNQDQNVAQKCRDGETIFRLLSQCINLHERLQKAVSSSQ